MNLQQGSHEIVNELVNMAAERIADGDDSLAVFVRHYYANVPDADLAERNIEDLYTTLLAQWHQITTRPPGTASLHIYNPTIEEHGWQSPHSILDLVTEDRPFLVESITMALNSHGLTNHIIFHPIFHLSRSASGKLLKIHHNGSRGVADVLTEAVIHIEFDRRSDPDELAALQQKIALVLEDVRAATDDWPLMLADLDDAILQLETDARIRLKNRPGSDLAISFEEAIHFLRWLKAQHFVFLGCRDYRIEEHIEGSGFSIVGDSGKGILRDQIATLPADALIPLTPDLCTIIHLPNPLIITKATTRSTVHRPVFLDYIGVKRFDSEGRVIGERRFLGLYSSSVYREDPVTIPLVARKLERLRKQSEAQGSPYSASHLHHVIAEMPRDELFHATAEEVTQTALGILQLQDRQRIRLFIRHDLYGCFFSNLLYAPRERYTTEIRKRLEKLLLERLHGIDINFRVHFTDSILARIHFIVTVPEGRAISFNRDELEAEIVQLFHDWKQDLSDSLISHYGEEEGNRLFLRYGDSFSAAYREDFSARRALPDIELMERLDESGGGLQITLYRPPEQASDTLRCKLFRSGQPAPLSLTLPMLENMGVTVASEHPYELRLNQTPERSLWIHDFSLKLKMQTVDLAFDTLKPLFQQALELIWKGKAENDGFNQLVLRASLTWREVAMLRAYDYYLKQTGTNFSQSSVEQALARNPAIVRLLVTLFCNRFDPELPQHQRNLHPLQQQISAAIEGVTSLDEDRILRSYLELIMSTVRTNYYQKGADGSAKPYLCFKIDPERVSSLPLPRPKHEIFVTSPSMEGVHLRGGDIARGGLRWSDRRDDYRTEVLGLMKAQIPKNAVIVPTGSKGGFVAKRLRDDMSREQSQNEVISSYRTFVSALLDISDNYRGVSVVKPAATLCYDDDDPYLVVAADKGTAAFSDIANEISAQYRFWLGDAFASGGSDGYDHKKMGITARGAWESVKHHFYRVDRNIESTPFTVVGIGGMSGDVFGNGMLLSQQIKLVAAFNHSPIFLDPDPDPALSFIERERLFSLPRASWADYDRDLISHGGGVFLRSAKVIPISPEMAAILGTHLTHVEPNELIRIILTAPVDLLWNGGIGTYVKSQQENNTEVGDRTNDSVRVNASELRCKVVGEGGNLGMTQRARVEYAALGGSINTDSIDNSAGVDSSDHEVNLKILLNRVVSDGDMTLKQRNQLLYEMTDEVAALVLQHNIQQNSIISAIEANSHDNIDSLRRLINRLVEEGALDRALDSLPGNEELKERKAAGLGLYRPEIAVLLAHVKLLLKQWLHRDEKLCSDTFAKQLQNYFPSAVREQCQHQIPNHRLSCEIVINEVANSVVDRLGILFPFRLLDEVGCSVVDLVTSYQIVSEIFATEVLWREIQSLDGKIEWPLQQLLRTRLTHLMERSIFWLQRYRRQSESASETLKFFHLPLTQLQPQLSQLLPESVCNKISAESSRWQQQGVSQPLADAIAQSTARFNCLDIIQVARKNNFPAEILTRLYYSLDDEIGLSTLRQQISALPRNSFWSSLARSALRDDLHKNSRALLTELIQEGLNVNDPDKLFDSWCQHHQNGLERYQKLSQEIQASGTIELEQITVAVKELRSLLS